MSDARRAIGVGLVLLGLTIGMVLVPALYDVTRAADWASVPGVVLASRVERVVTREADANGDEVTVERFRPHVTYRFTIAGKSRVADGFMTHDAASVDEAWARAQQARYPRGAVVRVYRSPDGERTVLVPGLSKAVWAWTALPALLLLAGWALLHSARGPHPTRMAVPDKTGKR